MSLAAGTRIGFYEVIALLGAGGMGEVYRARDARLQRDVALKILPDHLTDDPERLARFQREAQVLAALAHANIAHIYAIEDAPAEIGKTRALVLELVEGPTLADRIAQGPIAVDEAIAIARQIVEALDAAHEQGIVHRDLKPANIKLRDDGTVKVLDFGLAKLGSEAADASSFGTLSPTLSAAFTGAGMILGTAAYMAPEQARGKKVDKRADVWAFGCVLFEMLTGVKAFDGTDATEMIAAVVRGEPSWSALPADTPPAVVSLLRRCLQKDPRQRLRDIGDARYELEHTASPVIAASTATRLSWRAASAWALATVLVAIGAGLSAWLLKPSPERPVSRFEIPLNGSMQFTFPGRHMVAISPQGHLAFAADNQIYLRLRGQIEPINVRGTSTDAVNAARNPFFSPDGQWLGFWADGQLKKVSLSGGAPLTITPAQNPHGVTWAADNTVWFGQGREGIFRVSGDGGKAERIIQVKTSEAAHGPQLLPDARTVLFTLAGTGFGAWNEASVVLYSLDTGKQTVLFSGGTDARYVSSGHIVDSLNDALLAIPFDAARLRLTGGPVSLVEDVAQTVNGQTGAAQFSINESGSLVYIPQSSTTQSRIRRTLVMLDRKGGEQPIANAPPRTYRYPRFSHDGTRLALDIQDEDRDVWIWPFATGTLTRLTLESSQEQYALWTHDDARIVFSSSQSGPPNLYWQAANGTGKMERLTDSPNPQIPQAVTADGRLIFREETPDGGTDLMIMSLQGDRTPKPLIVTRFNERNAEVSPNGRWLAFQSNKSGGREEIFVTPFPETGKGEWQISPRGGTRPVWASDGELLYLQPAATGAPKLMTVTLKEANGALQALTPTALFDLDPVTTAIQGRAYDVSPDGQRILAVKSDATSVEQPAPKMILVQNWFEELKSRVVGR
jgi:eukaryotic-like serine/threonine-protein kinase